MKTFSAHLIFILLLALVPAQAQSQQRQIDPVVFEDAVNKLKDLGIIDDPKFWIDRAKPGQYIEAEPVRQLLIAAAAKFEPVTNIQDAVAVLQKNKALNATIGEQAKFAGGVVQVMILRLSQAIK